VPVIDSTAAATIEGFARKAKRNKASVYLVGTRPAVRRILLTHGARRPLVRFKGGLADALASAREELHPHAVDKASAHQLRLPLRT
jgi:SulP family sulfate permease